MQGMMVVCFSLFSIIDLVDLSGTFQRNGLAQSDSWVRPYLLGTG